MNTVLFLRVNNDYPCRPLPPRKQWLPSSSSVLFLPPRHNTMSKTIPLCCICKCCAVTTYGSEKHTYSTATMLLHHAPVAEVIYDGRGILGVPGRSPLRGSTRGLHRGIDSSAAQGHGGPHALLSMPPLQLLKGDAEDPASAARFRAAAAFFTRSAHAASVPAAVTTNGTAPSAPASAAASSGKSAPVSSVLACSKAGE